MESFVGAHSLNILSRLRSLSGGPSGGGCNWWQLRPHGNMGMALPSHHPGHLTWDQGCIWYFGRWEVHRNSPNHSQTRSFIPKSQNTSLLVIDLEHRRRTGSTSSKAGSPSFTSSDDHWTKEYHQGPSFDQDIAIPPLAVTEVPLWGETAMWAGACQSLSNGRFLKSKNF